MGIKEEIQQSEFKDIYQELAINLMFTSKWLEEKVKKELREFGLTPQQFNVLRILRGSHPKPLSTTQIRGRMLDRMSDTSRIVDRLVAKRLVKKQTSENDRRLVDVHIKKKGLKLLTKTDKEDENRLSMMQSLTEKEAELMSQLLDQLREKPSADE